MPALPVALDTGSNTTFAFKVTLFTRSWKKDYDRQNNAF